MTRGRRVPPASVAVVLLLIAHLVAYARAAPIESPDPSEAPTVGDRCEGEVDFQVSIKYDWEPPVSTGAEEERAGFTPLLCVAHGPEYTLWQFGQPVSDGITRFLREQNFTHLLDELKSNKTMSQSRVRDYNISRRTVVSSPGRDAVIVTVDASYNATLVSCIAGFVPSPDWFVGFSAQEMCEGNVTVGWNFVEKKLPLRSYDAEFDDLENFRGQRIPVVPARAVRFRVGLGQRIGTAVVADARTPPEKVKPTTENAQTSNPVAPLACFPGTAVTQLAGGTQVAMRDLRVAQRVRTGSGTHSEVFMFSHFDRDIWSPFVKLAFADPRANTTRALTASPGHYVHAFEHARADKPRLVAMDDIRIGDSLVGEDGHPLRVVRIARTFEQGLYNPHTIDGDLVVNGVRVSCYTRAVAPKVAEKALAPLRILHALGFSELVQRFTSIMLSRRFSTVLSYVLPSGV